MTANGTSGGFTPQELGAAFALAAGLFAAWLYLSGWAFAYAYFDQFHIPLLLADIPRDQLLAYGFWVLRDSAPVLAGLAILAGLIALRVIAAPWFRGRRMMGALWLLIGIATLGGMFLLGYQEARVVAADRAAEQRQGDFPAYPRVIADVSGGTPAHDFASGCYRLFLHTGNTIVLIRPAARIAADLPATVLSAARVMQLKVLPSYKSCE